MKYIHTVFSPDDADIYREIEKYHMVDKKSDENLYEYLEELDQKSTVSPTNPRYSTPTSLVGALEDEQHAGTLRFNTPPIEVISSSVEGGIYAGKSSSLRDRKYSNSYKSPRLEMLNDYTKSNTYNGHVEKLLMEENSSVQNITNLDQLIQQQSEDNMGGANFDVAGSVNFDKHHSYYQSEASVYGTGTIGRVVSISGVSDDDHSMVNSANILPTFTPINGPSSVLPSYVSLDRRHRAMSIRSARSRRNNLLKQGTSADGQAMSVIFMDNNEEYVNTGFAFAYNDESEINRRSRKNNPLFKAKSVDEIYERKRKRRQRMQRKNNTYLTRRQSQPDPSSLINFKR